MAECLWESGGSVWSSEEVKESEILVVSGSGGLRRAWTPERTVWPEAGEND